MNAQVLVLSSESPQSESWAAALRSTHPNAKVVREWPHAQRLLSAGAVYVVLYDADSAIAPPAEVLAVAGAAKLPVIVIARDFDVSQWLTLFRDGAFDILKLPAQPGQLSDSVDAAMKKLSSRALNGSPSWLRLVQEWVTAVRSRIRPARDN